MMRRDRSRSTPWRFTITAWLALNLSATSWAWLKDDGATTWGLALADAGTGRTTAARGLAGSPPLPAAASGRTDGPASRPTERGGLPGREAAATGSGRGAGRWGSRS